jgi:MFS family permease
MQRKIIRQYYILSCLFNAGGMQVIAAIYVTFLIKNGLNLLEVNLVNMAFFLTLFICEIPTGAFADIFGRKTSFVLACALMCLSMCVYGSSHTFAGFVVAEIIAGIAATFRSGAFQAWLVDSLKHHGYDGEYHHIFGREALIRQIGGGIGAVAGSYLAVNNPALP